MRCNVFMTRLLLIFLLIFLLVPQALAQNLYVTKSGYLAATNKELMDKAIEYSVAKDVGALQQLMNTGSVFQLKGGIPCYITKSSWGLVRIRPKGQTFEIWTVMEAVERTR